MPSMSRDVQATAHLSADRALLVTCFLLVMFDGFDNQSIGFAAPAIAREWSLPAALLGPIFSAGLLGGCVGAAALGWLGDRFGTSRGIRLSVLILSFGTTATLLAGGFTSLVLIRFVTGIGLGGALTNLISFAASLAPPHRRALTVSFVLIGIPLGAGAGGIVAAELIERIGWRSIFMLGAFVPLAILAAQMLLEQRRPQPAQGVEKKDRLRFESALRSLLDPERRTVTLLLWTGNFIGAMLSYTLAVWLPALLTQAHHSLRFAVLATSLLNAGAVLGGVAVGRSIDRLGAPVSLVGAYLLGGGAIAFMGASEQEWVLLIAISFAAIFALGGNTGIGAVTSSFYPAKLRTTGVGATMAAGRVGSVLGPLIVSVLLAKRVGIDAIFVLASGAAFLAAVLFFVLRKQLGAGLSRFQAGPDLHPDA